MRTTPGLGDDFLRESLPAAWPDPLRGRADFQKLLAELEKGAGKGKPSDDRPKK
jgi:hypothetical protein